MTATDPKQTMKEKPPEGGFGVSYWSHQDLNLGPKNFESLRRFFIGV